MKSTPNLEDSDEKHPPPAWDGKRKKGLEAIRSVNMHQLGVKFVERVLDVWRRHTDDGKAAAPGASLEFLTNSGVAIGRAKEEKSTTTAAQRHTLGYELRWGTQ